MNDHSRPPAPEAPAGGLALQNRLPPGHHYRAGLEDALRAALRDLSGPWDVSLYPVGRAWFSIDVVAPDASRWSMAVPVHQGPRAEDLADTVRAACVRHCRLKPTNGRRRSGKPAGGSAGNRDGAPKAGSPRDGVASVSPPAAPGGTPK